MCRPVVAASVFGNYRFCCIRNIRRSREPQLGKDGYQQQDGYQQAQGPFSGFFHKNPLLFIGILKFYNMTFYFASAKSDSFSCG